MNGWRFVETIGGDGFYAFHHGRPPRYYGIMDFRPLGGPSPTFEQAMAGGKRREITAAAAYEICRSNGQWAKFCELTGYVP